MRIIVIIIIGFFVCLPASATRVVEDFSTYTEVDAAGTITVTSTRVTSANTDRNQNTYVYFDKGVNFFDGNFEHWGTYNLTNNALWVGHFWAVTNDVGARSAWGNSLLIYTGNATDFCLMEEDSGSDYPDCYINVTNTDMFVKIIRDESVGANGTLYMYIYLEAARTTLLDTLTLTLHTSLKDYRYIYAIAGPNDGVSGRDFDGYVDSLSLSEAVAAAGGGHRRITED